MSQNNKTSFYIISTLFSLFLFFLMGEVLIRLINPLGVVSRMKEQAQIISQKTPPFNTAEKDEFFGWKCKENYDWQGTLMDAGGEGYPVQISFKEDGFRKYNSRPEAKTKFLLIGDSYTQSVEVSDNKTFFNIWEDSLDINLYVYGMAGYGTFQQLMILEKHIKKINPDVVMLQYCANDFIDNYWELEENSAYRVGLTRPYFSENNAAVIYKNPTSSTRKWFQWSAFYQLLDYTLGNQIRQKKGTSEFHIGNQGKDYLPFKKSIDMTQKILQRMKETVGNDRQFYIMAADGFFPQLQEFRTICKELDIWLMESGVHRMNEARDSGKVFHSSDGYHWNEYGHELIGQAVLGDLKLASPAW
ncbi:MAG: SGNH/GDSL hydrolase family protein [Bacteroidetes bacterium]|nr:SGNH/GDSL hydrolase family protein [Bacteroidota bacterium]